MRGPSGRQSGDPQNQGVRVEGCAPGLMLTQSMLLFFTTLFPQTVERTFQSLMKVCTHRPECSSCVPASPDLLGDPQELWLSSVLVLLLVWLLLFCVSHALGSGRSVSVLVCVCVRCPLSGLGGFIDAELSDRVFNMLYEYKYTKTTQKNQSVLPGSVLHHQVKQSFIVYPAINIQYIQHTQHTQINTEGKREEL